jgi:H+/Cl- antiporter ClcA
MEREKRRELILQRAKDLLEEKPATPHSGDASQSNSQDRTLEPYATPLTVLVGVVFGLLPSVVMYNRITMLKTKEDAIPLWLPLLLISGLLGYIASAALHRVLRGPQKKTPTT